MFRTRTRLLVLQSISWGYKPIKTAFSSSFIQTGEPFFSLQLWYWIRASRRIFITVNPGKRGSCRRKKLAWSWLISWHWNKGAIQEHELVQKTPLMCFYYIFQSQNIQKLHFQLHTPRRVWTSKILLICSKKKHKNIMESSMNNLYFERKLSVDMPYLVASSEPKQYQLSVQYLCLGSL